MKKTSRIIAIIMALSIVFFLADFARAKINKEPIFAVEIAFYSDGGTREYVGLLGYKVIAYAVIEENGGLTDEVICQMGTWCLSYDENFPRFK